jgi:hypothetical protein
MNNYDTIKLYIPMELIKSEDEHPEEYGCKIVTLQNGMWTDVYQDDDGLYYSLTNDDRLIAYVRSYNQK